MPSEDPKRGDKLYRVHDATLETVTFLGVAASSGSGPQYEVVDATGLIMHCSPAFYDCTAVEAWERSLRTATQDTEEAREAYVEAQGYLTRCHARQTALRKALEEARSALAPLPTEPTPQERLVAACTRLLAIDILASGTAAEWARARAEARAAIAACKAK